LANLHEHLAIVDPVIPLHNKLAVIWRGFLGGEKSKVFSFSLDSYVVAEVVTNTYNIPVAMDVWYNWSLAFKI